MRRSIKNALQRAKDWADGKHGHSVTDTPKDISEYLFPELLKSGDESNDERIRKALIELVRMVDKNPIHQIFGYGDIKYSDMIAWLEKQRYSEFELENEYWRGYDDAKKKQDEDDERILRGLSGLVRDCYLNGGYTLPMDEYNEYKEFLNSLYSRKQLTRDKKYEENRAPVSKDLEEAAKHYLYSNILYDDVYVGEPTDKDCIEMFKAGAQWQKEKIKRVIDKIDVNNHSFENLEDLYDSLCEMTK